jgi:hypothetical protein
MNIGSYGGSANEVCKEIVKAAENGTSTSGDNPQIDFLNWALITLNHDILFIACILDYRFNKASKKKALAIIEAFPIVTLNIAGASQDELRHLNEGFAAQRKEAESVNWMHRKLTASARKADKTAFDFLFDAGTFPSQCNGALTLYQTGGAFRMGRPEDWSIRAKILRDSGISLLRRVP